jgi:hypothetical protein
MVDAKVKATIYLPEDVHRQLKIRAAQERSSMTELVLRAIGELLARPVASDEPRKPTQVRAHSRSR